jgi:hypothetical protein
MSDYGQVTSGCSPEKNQNNRSSSNFKIDAPKGTTQFQWTVSNADTSPSDISFVVWIDNNLGRDSQAYGGQAISNGFVGEALENGSKYYIGNPSGCSSKGDTFLVTVSAPQ